MKIDLSKYLINKDTTVNNEDFDLEKLSKDMSKDILKGYVKESEVEKPDYSNYVPKADYDKLQGDYSTLETNYNNQTKVLSDTNDKVARISLENKLVKKGFKEADYDEVIKLRQNLYSEEKDDDKALDAIASRFKGTYMADKETTTQYTKAPNEAGMSGKGSTNGGNENKPNITRNTSIKDLMIPVTK
jgi:hypothetical protein